MTDSLIIDGADISGSDLANKFDDFFVEMGNKNELTNYRPISILPIFSRGFEKVINSRIIAFAEKNNLITEHQFGFRKFRSTEDALLVHEEIVLENFENRLATLGIY